MNCSGNLSTFKHFRADTGESPRAHEIKFHAKPQQELELLTTLVLVWPWPYFHCTHFVSCMY